jgi:hypothetical protein
MALTLTKAAASATPIVGGPAAELLGAVIGPAISRRSIRWLERLAQRVQKLERLDPSLTPAALAENEAFQTTLLHASQLAIRAHQEETLEELCNAVLNVAVGFPLPDDRRLVFLDALDALTPSHVRMLTYFADPSGWATRNNVKVPQSWHGTVGEALEQAIPEFKEQKDFCKLLYTQLYRSGFVTVDAVILDSAGPLVVVQMLRASDLGKQFLAFITSPVGDD